MTFDPNRPATPEPVPGQAPAPASVPAAAMEGATFSAQPVVPGAPRVQVRARRSSAAFLNVILVLAAVVAVGGVAFALGRNTAPVAAAAGRGTGNGNFGGGNFGNRSFAPGASGAPGGGGGFGGGFLGGAAGFNLSGTV